MITREPFGLRGAALPWAGARCRAEQINSYDTQKQIARCVACPKPDCDNCVGQRVTRAQERRRAQFIRLYNRGLTDRELAQHMSLTVPTVCYYRKRLNLPPNKPPPAKTK